MSNANQQELTAALAKMRELLDQHARGESTRPNALELSAPALDQLSNVFNLSPFERHVLLLCAGVELDAKFSTACAAAQADATRPYATFGLALAALPDAHWSAVTPVSSLRRWKLVEVANPGASLLTSPLRIDERVLHFLTGVQYVDERLAGVIEPVGAAEVAPSHQALARRAAEAWSRAEGPLPVIELCGTDELTRRSITAVAASAVSMNVYATLAENIPTAPAEMEAFVRLWERESALMSAVLYVEAENVDRSEPRPAAHLSRFLERAGGAVVLGTRERWKPLRRALMSIDVRKPTADEQRSAWNTLLEQAPMPLNGHVNELVAQFNLGLPAIRASVREASMSAASGNGLDRELWSASRAQARVRLDDLAQRIEPVAGWDDLVLPDAEKTLLRHVAAQVGRRAKVYDEWGFAEKANRGLGISALFAGPSGTGKTMAAEVLAGALSLDLYRIDLASIVSKYIGETEKNLKRVFDAAEDGGAILFFDEADALFGKRSEVKDSHDRYANIEISYLLQRMEGYRGLAILATNMKGSVDAAFLRRVRFVVNFPFPDLTRRCEIWKRAFPERTPAEDLDFTKLSRLNVAGGNIKNIALNAAFLAADAGEPVRMNHILTAARAEYSKLEKPLTDSEIGGWG